MKVSLQVSPFPQSKQNVVWQLLLVLAVLLALAGCQGVSAGSQQPANTNTNPGSPSKNASAMGSNPIEPANWGFMCIYWSDDCGLNGSWLPTQAQPGTVRLWQAGTEWAFLNTGKNSYDWRYLDTWLDLVAEHQATTVMYTFGLVPCWNATVACDGVGWGMEHNFAPGPPIDLTSSGSPAFNAFVTQLVQHCSAAGHCVKDSIKYWEMWNEANTQWFWAGTPTQLYAMFKPVIPIIRYNIPGAVISTPPVTGGDAPWMTSWMTLENTNGRLSDYYGIHIYLESFTPEQRLEMLQKMLSIKNANGWSTTPWMNTETNFDNITFTCSTQYSAEDCRGQFVRWHVLQYAYQGGGGGAFNIGWFKWESAISGGYDTYDQTLMQWLTGATFTASCSSTGTVWTCPLREANGSSALIVWNTAGDSQYTAANEYVDYRSFNGTYVGATQSMTSGQSTTIGVVPIMFESGK
jgi:hypothetical protein